MTETLRERFGPEYVVGCRKFKDYSSIDQYIEDVVICLVYSSWQYTEEQAREIVEEDMKTVREYYEKHIAADSCCAEIGYFCG